jgi:hypothetical protein
MDRSFLEIIKMIINGLTDSYQNYSNSLSYVNSNTIGESVFVALNVFMYFFRFLVFPLSIIYWNKISKFQKRATIFLVLLECLKWLLKGMNKGIFDLVLIFFASLLIATISNKKISDRKKVKKKIKKIYGIIIILIIGAIIMFAKNDVSRNKGNSYNYYNARLGLHANPENIALQIIPQKLHDPFLTFSLYLTQGYYAVSMGVGLDFESCFGVGHNMFFISNMQQYLKIDLWPKTYMVRIEEQYPWDSLVNWHSIYSWIANDVSYMGVPIVFFLLGLFFARLWKDSIVNKNPFASLLFILLFIEFFYIPANNQIGAFPYMTVTFYITLITWLVTRKKYSQGKEEYLELEIVK